MSDTYNMGSIDAATFDELYRSLKHRNDSSMLEFLEDGGDPNLRNREGGWTLLHAAASMGRRALVEALLAKGAEVDAITDPGFTPLAMAVHSAQVACVRMLLEAGASLDCRPLGMPLLDSLRYAKCPSKTVRAILNQAAAAGGSNQLSQSQHIDRRDRRRPRLSDV